MRLMNVVSPGSRFRRWGLLSLALAVASPWISCDRAGGDAGQGLDGVATLALTAVEGVISVKIEFQAGARTVSRCVEVDGKATTRLTGLPTGTVLVNASAYPVPGCLGEPSWLADPQTVRLAKGQAVAISIVFRPNGTAVISTTYIDDGSEVDAGGTDGSGVDIGVPFTVAGGVFRPAAVATDGRAVVWTNVSSIWMCPVEGCGALSPSNLIEMWPMAGDPVVDALVLDANYAYWLDGTESPVAQRCALTGCMYGPERLVSKGSDDRFVGLAVGPSAIYLNDRWNLYQCPFSGCGGTAVRVFGEIDASGTYLATDATGLYFGMHGQTRGTYYCAFASCPPTYQRPPLLSSVGRMVAYGGTVYLQNGSVIASCPNTGCSNIMTTLATGQSNVTSMAADGYGVYWIRSQGADAGATGEVLMCPLPDCTGGPRVLASAQTNPVSIAASQGHVFWVNRGLTGSDGAILGVTLR